VLDLFSRCSQSQEEPALRSRIYAAEAFNAVTRFLLARNVDHRGTDRLFRVMIAAGPFSLWCKLPGTDAGENAQEKPDGAHVPAPGTLVAAIEEAEQDGC
jgi:hypothetical protein